MRAKRTGSGARGDAGADARRQVERQACWAATSGPCSCCCCWRWCTCGGEGCASRVGQVDLEEEGGEEGASVPVVLRRQWKEGAGEREERRRWTARGRRPGALVLANRWTATRAVLAAAARLPLLASDLLAAGAGDEEEGSGADGSAVAAVRLALRQEVDAAAGASWRESPSAPQVTGEREDRLLRLSCLARVSPLSLSLAFVSTLSERERGSCSLAGGRDDDDGRKEGRGREGRREGEGARDSSHQYSLPPRVTLRRVSVYAQRVPRFSGGERETSEQELAARLELERGRERTRVRSRCWSECEGSACLLACLVFSLCSLAHTHTDTDSRCLLPRMCEGHARAHPRSLTRSSRLTVPADSQDGELVQVPLHQLFPRSLSPSHQVRRAVASAARKEGRRQRDLASSPFARPLPLLPATARAKRLLQQLVSLARSACLPVPSLAHSSVPVPRLPLSLTRIPLFPRRRRECVSASECKQQQHQLHVKRERKKQKGRR